MRRPVLVAALVVAAAALLVIAVPVRAVADAVQSVLITNWPKSWDVRGNVSIDGPVKLAKGVAIRDLTVPPVNPRDTGRLIQGATIETDGFTNMVISLQGQIKGEVYRQGTVGVFLLPDEDPIVKVFDEKGIMQFAQEVNAPGVSGASPYFASSQPKLPVAFSRYRTYFYNSADKTVTVNLFVYLTN